MKKEKGILSSYDSLDIDEVIITIEKTFHIKFDERDFEKVKTYGDFENLVLNKIEGRETEDCCSQQTFYKLRKIFIEEFNIPFEKINPKTQLENIIETAYEEPIAFFILNVYKNDKYRENILKQNDNFFINEHFGAETNETGMQIFEFKSLWKQIDDETKDYIKKSMVALVKISQRYILSL